MTDSLRSDVEALGRPVRIARVRWVPSGSAAQTLTEAEGVTGVARTGAGAYTITLKDLNLKDAECFVSVIENDTTVRHTARVDSMSLSAGTFAVTHKVSTFAAEASAVTVGTQIADVSAASKGYAVAPIAGTISKIYSALGGAISVANSLVTCKIGATGITNGVLTITAAASAAGDVDVATPTALNTVVAGDLLVADSDGGSTDAATLDVFFVIQGTGSTPAASDTVDQLQAVIFYRVYD